MREPDWPAPICPQGSSGELSAATLEKRQRRKLERDRKKRKRKELKAKELKAKEQAVKADKEEKAAEAPPEVACKKPQELGLIFNKASGSLRAVGKEMPPGLHALA